MRLKKKKYLQRKKNKSDEVDENDEKIDENETIDLNATIEEIDDNVEEINMKDDDKIDDNILYIKIYFKHCKLKRN